jgi:hydrogenase maturation protease
VSRDLALKVADTVLYEGYMLYPYRPSAIKNRQRWTFGILYPPAYEEVRAGTERASMHSECVVLTGGETVINLQLRFLQLLAREVMASIEEGLSAVPSLIVDGQVFESWDQGVERSVKVHFLMSESQQRDEFGFPGSYESESLADKSGHVAGRMTRTQHEVKGSISLRSEAISGSALKLTIDVANEVALPPDVNSRNAAFLQSLVSAQTILTVTGGEFVSLLEPPDNLRDVVSSCRQVGNFPVLLGEPGTRDMLLCSPILLYDYPRIAPETVGDFFDGTEMDEMLTLRVMTLTDQEKSEMRQADARTRDLLQRTEETARRQLGRVHGVIRSLRPLEESREP